MCTCGQSAAAVGIRCLYKSQLECLNQFQQSTVTSESIFSVVRISTKPAGQQVVAIRQVLHLTIHLFSDINFLRHDTGFSCGFSREYN